MLNKKISRMFFLSSFVNCFTDAITEEFMWRRHDCHMWDLFYLRWIKNICEVKFYNYQLNHRDSFESMKIMKPVSHYLFSVLHLLVYWSRQRLLLSWSNMSCVIWYIWLEILIGNSTISNVIIFLKIQRYLLRHCVGFHFDRVVNG